MIKIRTTKILDANREIIEGQIIETHLNAAMKPERQILKSLAGEVITMVKHIYSNERLIRVEEYENDVIVLVRSIDYGQTGKLAKEVLANSDGQILRTKIYSNSIIEENEFDFGELVSVTKKYLNAAGQIIKEVEDEDYISINEYSEGNLVNTKAYKNNTLVMNEDYFYDANKNEIRSEGVDYETGETTHVLKRYTNFNKLSAEEILINELPISKREVKYDDRQRVIEDVSTDLLDGEIELTDVIYE